MDYIEKYVLPVDPELAEAIKRRKKDSRIILS